MNSIVRRAARYGVVVLVCGGVGLLGGRLLRGDGTDYSIPFPEQSEVNEAVAAAGENPAAALGVAVTAPEETGPTVVLPEGIAESPDNPSGAPDLTPSTSDFEPLGDDDSAVVEAAEVQALRDVALTPAPEVVPAELFPADAPWIPTELPVLSPPEGESVDPLSLPPTPVTGHQQPRYHPINPEKPDRPTPNAGPVYQDVSRHPRESEVSE